MVESRPVHGFPPEMEPTAKKTPPRTEGAARVPVAVRVGEKERQSVLRRPTFPHAYTRTASSIRGTNQMIRAVCNNSEENELAKSD